MQALSSLDAFQVTKLGDEFTQRSASGGALTLLAYVLGLALFVQELRLYQTVERVTDLFVDTDDAQLMPIHLDVTFHRLPCGVTGLDVDNLIGETEENVAAVTKTRLDATGNEIGEEDQFITEMPSTEVPMWQKQRMAQRAEVERELLRQKEAQDAVGREGVRRQLLLMSRRALTSSGQQQPESLRQTSDVASTSAGVVAVDSSTLAPVPTRTAAVLQEEMKKKLDGVVADLHYPSHDPVVVKSKPVGITVVEESSANTGAVAAKTERQAATHLTASASASEIQAAGANKDATHGSSAKLVDHDGEAGHNTSISDAMETRAVAGTTHRQPKSPTRKKVTADEELKQLTEYYHISPPSPTHDEQTQAVTLISAQVPASTGPSPPPHVPKSWTPVSGNAQMVRPGNHNHPPAPAAPTLLLNGVPVGGESVSGADRGYDKGAAEARVHEGCRVKGVFSVQRVPGNFHFSSHAYAGKFMRTTTMRQFFPPGLFPELGGEDDELDLTKVNMSHTIHHLAFGADSLLQHRQQQEEPMQDARPQATGSSYAALTGQRGTAGELIEYYITAVPTLLTRIDGSMSRSFQYTAQHHSKLASEQNTLPAVVFMYELSPMTVRTRETRRPMLGFLTSMCAIVGGVLSTMGIVDKLVLWLLSFSGTGVATAQLLPTKSGVVQ